MAAAVILDTGQAAQAAARGVRDSKKLSPQAREALFAWLTAGHCRYGIAMQAAAAIDASNILRATMQAMTEALAQLSPPPRLALIDGPHTPEAILGTWPLPRITAVPLKGGDDRHTSVAAASVLTKVFRDRLMVKAEARWPGYGFAAHKGYGTAQHRAALARIGCCPLHRKSFAPIRALLQSRRHDSRG